jgi:hypothetical protein
MQLCRFDLIPTCLLTSPVSVYISRPSQKLCHVLSIIKLICRAPCSAMNDHSSELVYAEIEPTPKHGSSNLIRSSCPDYDRSTRKLRTRHNSAFYICTLCFRAIYKLQVPGISVWFSGWSLSTTRETPSNLPQFSTSCGLTLTRLLAWTAGMAFACMQRHYKYDAARSFLFKVLSNRSSYWTS